MARFTQAERSMRVATPLGDDVLLLVRFTAHEAMSSLFSYRLEMLSEKPDIAFDDIVGKNVTITVRSADKERFFNGIVKSFEQGATSLEMTRYYAEVVPYFWQLTLTSDCRVWIKDIDDNKSAVDIIKAVLDEHKCEYDDGGLSKKGKYPKRGFLVQYRQSDFDFVSWLMEEEGIHYFFKHEDGSHVLVLADDASANEPCPDRDEARFNPERGVRKGDETVFAISKQQHVRSTKVVLRDFNYETPKDPVDAQKGDDGWEVYDYPGEFTDSDQGTHYAGVRLEEQKAQTLLFHGSSDCRGFASGFRFKLTDHLFEGEMLLREVHHTATEEGSYQSGRGGGGDLTYENRFVAMPHDIKYVPLRRTSRPRVWGAQTAKVVGPAGEEIHTDKYGRIKIQFHWDREGGKDDKSSCWVRVSQTWAGKNWGGLYLPRIGMEVIVEFLEGDPDRPFVTGCVYNDEYQPAVSLPGDMTQSSIMSRSSKKGQANNFNEIRFEDKKGEEVFSIQAEKDKTVLVKNDRSENVGHDETISIGNDRTETVGNDEKITIGNNRTETVGVNEDITIGSNRTETVGSNENVTVGVTRTHTIGVNDAVTVGAAQEVTVGAARSLTVGAVQETNIGANESLAVGKNRDVTVGKDLSQTVGENYTHKTGKKILIDGGDEITIQSGKAQITLKKNGDITINGKKITVKGSGDIVMKGKKILQN